MNSRLRELVTRTMTTGILVAAFATLYCLSLDILLLCLAIAGVFIAVTEAPRLYNLQGLARIGAMFIFPGVPMAALLLFIQHFYIVDFWLSAYPIIIASVADICAYLVGSVVGYTKMCPTISPRKSWEGFFGGVTGVFAANLVLMPLLKTQPFIGYGLQYGVLVSYSCAIATMAFLGGLLLSWLKRKQSLKDAGSLLPGHGGLLDRADSIFGVVLLLWVLYAIGR